MLLVLLSACVAGLVFEAGMLFVASGEPRVAGARVLAACTAAVGAWALCRLVGLGRRPVPPREKERSRERARPA